VEDDQGLKKLGNPAMIFSTAFLLYDEMEVLCNKEASKAIE